MAGLQGLLIDRSSRKEKVLRNVAALIPTGTHGKLPVDSSDVLSFPLHFAHTKHGESSDGSFPLKDFVPLLNLESLSETRVGTDPEAPPHWGAGQMGHIAQP